MEFIQANIFLFAIAALSGTAWVVLTLRGNGQKNLLAPTQATSLINREDALVIDVRDLDEYAVGHVPESRNIPLSHLAERASELNERKDSPLILVCQTGVRTGAASKQLTALGFSRVYALEGGLNAWRTAGLPLKKGAKK